MGIPSWLQSNFVFIFCTFSFFFWIFKAWELLPHKIVILFYTYRNQRTSKDSTLQRLKNTQKIKFNNLGVKKGPVGWNGLLNKGQLRHLSENPKFVPFKKQSLAFLSYEHLATLIFRLHRNRLFFFFTLWPLGMPDISVCRANIATTLRPDRTWCSFGQTRLRELNLKRFLKIEFLDP